MTVTERPIDNPEANQGCTHAIFVQLTREELLVLLDKGEVCRKVGNTTLSVFGPGIQRYGWPGVEL